MKIKNQVKYWLEKYASLRDCDNRLCSNFWAEELSNLNLPHKDFLTAYANNKLSSATTIRRARAKLQEECPELRGEKYQFRQTALVKKFQSDLGYEVN